MDFYVSYVTDRGIKKDVNQDSLCAKRIVAPSGNMAFAVLCDGMGGLSHGEIASSMIVDAFFDWIYSSLPRLSCGDIDDGEIRREWCGIIDEQNQKIRAFGKESGFKLGSTVTAMLLTEKRYYILNIGDSRAYLITRSGIRRLTNDHTVVADEISLGNMTPEQGESSPLRSVLTKCVGIEENAEPDMFFGDIEPDGIYLLCSDGFRHCVTEEEMRQTFLSCAPEAAEDGERALIELNISRGETDNISVVTVYVC